METTEVNYFVLLDSERARERESESESESEREREREERERERGCMMGTTLFDS